jgi:hypothetical protein
MHFLADSDSAPNLCPAAPEDMARQAPAHHDGFRNRMVRRSVSLDDHHRLEWWDEIMIASCRPLLPAGDAHSTQLETDWRYMGTVVLVPTRDPAFVQHRFRHAAHPGYHEKPCYVHVADSDLGPELCAISIGGAPMPVPRCYVGGCQRGRHRGPHQLMTGTICGVPAPPRALIAVPDSRR